MSHQEKFMNIHIEMPKTLIDSFLKEIEPMYSFQWVKNEKHHILVIYGDTVYELPFLEEADRYILMLFELQTNEPLLAFALKQLFFEARKRKLGIETLEERKKRRADERQKALLAIRTRRNHADMERKEQKETIAAAKRVEQYEIDYMLMELHDAIVQQDEAAADTIKAKLQLMLNNKAEN